ncbi:hypothetical protein V2J59_24575 [Pseudomonas alliivorans]|uniref:DUF4365 domain-containing protein n=1 Tax=Pseudomonas alliivorans TaxID=2810613 RepID=A0ABS4CDK7_9PSED|nr:hypothetical protein [Pseudomonas alliivorans]MBP0948422.1 hypothetical protein [Pseudomonas alliivorans]MEE4328801.1 hypothetical protein [Pseudomonas alliivorans]MEE4370402.1 hypothetical protein [Pseudomonas alliivorans]
MPALRGKNLRSGDVTEQLGTLLLQSLALVAPVPRTEDVGVDVVATLLEDFDRTLFKATNSFYVQIKSSSVKFIEYEDEEVEWLFALELPFFIASVNKRKLQIELYCCHALHEAYVVNPARKRLRIEFGSGSMLDEFMPADSVVNVGPPVFSWSMIDLDQADLRARFCAVCKAHIAVMKLSFEFRRVGRVETLVWKTGDLPEIVGFKSLDPVSREKIGDLSDLAVPYLVPFLDICVRHGDDYWLDQILLLTQERRLLLHMYRAQMSPQGTPLPIPEEFRFILERRARDEMIAERTLEQHKASFGADD